MDDETYAKLQVLLQENLEVGDLIEGTGGLRKVRVAAKGHGKRGGARVIY
ncbi:type II toxin-antitoxin system RelE/ParE family toxin [Xanthomonas translucens]|nr:type II toxin-antitoxin system RelE/ParE family toxin [Xanthomonas translucens]MCS3361291.1 type II toxin-antitoxin system RelE/ParE family toxin [Xanthomonas translucens pv. translucens]MCS3375030.1 type II toxin-antitoxin system RelE/ParE family toxin [Xanthomonas translucens pv. translucens]MCT8275217.1 type II toxin-antitoxin system RelE/ParE family toxin [Xanthomonas translucens pv. translucens]MCT8278910.1 type II toxin-antitoxin system RelE/ParE family toxin [Xanthomonas translucens p